MDWVMSEKDGGNGGDNNRGSRRYGRVLPGSSLAGWGIRDRLQAGTVYIGLGGVAKSVGEWKTKWPELEGLEAEVRFLKEEVKIMGEKNNALEVQLQTLTEEQKDMVFETVELRDISHEDAKATILDYFIKAKGKKVYVTDILRDLLIDPDLTMDIMDELEEEGLIGEKKKKPARSKKK